MRASVLKQKRINIRQRLWNGSGLGVEKASVIAGGIIYGPIMGGMSADFMVMRSMGEMGII
jgi:hypothetical protein